MSRVLVTGASGFIGIPLLRALAEQGEEVHALARHDPPAEVTDLAAVRWHRLDLADERSLVELLGVIEPERLIHLAWYVEHGRFWTAPENVVWVERSLSLLRAFAQAGGQRAVLLGTCAEYDWSDAGEPLSELRSPLAPATLYGVAKDSLRRLASAYSEQAGFELAWGRLFFLYGPREAPGRLVAAVIRSLLAGEQVQTSSGTQRRDFLHVDDVGRALAALAASTAVGPVNIASGEAVAIGEVVDRIAALTGREELVLRGARADAPNDPPLLAADAARLRDEVGFAARLTLDEGIAQTVEWWRAEAARR